MRRLLERHWTFAAVFILVLGAVWIWLSIMPPGSTTSGAIPAPQKGFLAPDFALSTLEGDDVTLSDLRGKAMLLNFWATWCPPCRAEMPAMQRVYSDYDPDEFVILAVNNTQQDSMDAVDAFVLEQELSFPVLLDITGDVSGLYQVTSMPTSFFVDAEGIIREVVIGGPMSEALLRTRVERLLEEMD
jgi:peroxiredoxin